MDKERTRWKQKELGLSCMLNLEVGALLALCRLPREDAFLSPHGVELGDSPIQQGLKSLRALIFNPQQEWRTIDPSIYLTPFLDVMQSDSVPAPATFVALASVLKMLKFEIFDEKTPGAKEAMNSIVVAVTSCRLEKTDPVAEEGILVKILHLLSGVMTHRASVWLQDHAVCTLVNSCFQVIQHSSSRGDLLRRIGRHMMHDMIQMIFTRFPDFEVKDEAKQVEYDNEDADRDDGGGYGIQCCIDIFHFLCSLLNVVKVVENAEGNTVQKADEEVQLFALVMLNTVFELGGDGIAKHPKFLRMVQDDLLHHLIHHAVASNPFILSVICGTILNIYHFLRRYIRLQLEAFFSFVLLRVTATGFLPLQEVGLEVIINFCRQPTFTFEAYVNYDCDPFFRSLFEEIGKTLCKHAFPGSGSLSPLQLQAFEGLLIIIHNIADNIDRANDSSPTGPYPVEIKDYRPFWEEKSDEDFEAWVEHTRLRKVQKRKLLIAAYHFNREVKKGLEYLKINNLVSDPPDPKAFAYFFRFVPGLDKTAMGDYLGDADGFNIQVLKEFTQTFEFACMALDNALRTFLETFRLPGESQKIQRILEAFSEKFYEQESSDLFASKDTVDILCYSLIMLNTDQHNPQVKKKMTEDEFIRNNRGINAGKDLPREYLSELFQSISMNAIAVFASGPLEMNPNRWLEMMNRAKTMQPFVLCDFDRRLGRDMFACIAGPSVATLSAFFEHADDEMLHECVDGMISVARIAQYGLEDILDELITSFCKFTTLLNPYTTPEEILFTFSHDLKPRMATLAVFTIANSFGESIRGGWRNIVDCLLKLKRLKLLPSSVIDFDTSDENVSSHEKSDSGVVFPNQESKCAKRQNSGLMGRFSHFLSLESVEDSVSLGMNEFEQNLKIIKQCRIGSIFSNSSNLPDVAMLSLGRSLIFAAAGKGQKFSTPIEEEETVIFCWDLIAVLAQANVHRLPTFWSSYHEYLLTAVQFPLFSPIPFAEKGTLGLFKICLKLLASLQEDRLSEELIFRSINLMWKLDKEIVDTCCVAITDSVCKIITECPGNLQTQIGWKSVLQLLSVCGRQTTYDQAVDALITFMSDATHVAKINYTYCIDCAFGFVALKNSPLEKNIKILDLMSNSVSILIEWYKNAASDSSNNYSVASNMSNSWSDDGSRGANFFNLFIRLGEALKKTSLARREDIRNYAVVSLQKALLLTEELDFSPSNCINCFNLVIFAMVDDLHEKVLEYSRRDYAEKEMRSMEGTLSLAMQLLAEVFLHHLKQLAESPDFRTFWLGVLRRMDTCMKATLGEYGETQLQEVVPELLTKMISQMKETEILAPKEGNDLWDITYIQIQWIAPALKEELFPDEEI